MKKREESIRERGVLSVFGIGAGKIELKLPKTAFSPGEKIDGKLLLSLSGPMNAKGLFVRLYAEQSFREKDAKGNMTVKTRRIYDFPLQLDGEKEYPKTAEPLSYDFELKVPESAGQKQEQQSPLPGWLSSVSIGLLQIGGSGPVGLPRWFVEGHLDIPLAFDIKARVQLNI